MLGESPNGIIERNDEVNEQEIKEGCDECESNDRQRDNKQFNENTGPITMEGK